MKKYVRYAIKGLAIFIGLFILVFLVAYTYVALNKKSIIAQVKEQVADKLNGEIQIGDISLGFLNTFPHISVLLENVSVKDTLFNEHHHPFFTGKKIYLNLSITRLLQKNNPINGIRVDNGQLYVYTDTSGYTNAYLFSAKSNAKAATKTSASKMDIESVRLRNVRLIFENLEKSKLYDFDIIKYACNIKTTDSVLTLTTNNNILVRNLSFNSAAGSFIKEAGFKGDFNVVFDKVKKQASFHDIHVEIKNHPFTLSGAFNFTNAPTFSLNVATKNIDYNFAKSLLTEKISTALSIVKVEKPINEARAEISGPLNGGDPLVNATYTCNGNNVQSPYANFNNCSFNGSYTNEVTKGLPRKDPNSRLQFHNFSGLWHNLIIKSKNIYIDNLQFPIVNADIKTDFDLTQLNDLIRSNTFDLHNGKGLLDITFSGPLQQNTKKNTLLNGKCTFSDGILMYHPRNIEVKNLNGDIVFKNTDVLVNDFRGNAQGSKIIMNGSGKNLIALLRTNPGKMFIDWNIYSPSLNLGNFTSLLKQRIATTRKNNAKSKIGENLDEIVNQANFHLDVKADQLIYKRFIGSNVKASLGLVNENWILNNVSINHGGGSMFLNGYLNVKNSKYYEAKVKANLQNVDVNKIFYAFNNFGQNGITSENLRGKLTSTADVKMDIERDLAGTPSNMEGYVDFSLKKGALLHYEPLLKIQDLAFTKRNFGEIYFAELKDRFDIKNREIIINRMEIESTVLTLFVEGVYSLRGNTDISIQVPLSNIAKRDDDYKPENKGANAKGGASIYMRGTPGEDGSIKFKLDLFKKLRRKDKKDKSDSEKNEKDNSSGRSKN